MGVFVRRTAAVAFGLTLACFQSLLFAAKGDSEISKEAAKLNQRGIDLLHKKEYEQAIASFREALRIQPEYWDALDNLGKALEAVGKDAEAIVELDKAIAIAPETAAAYADKGMALFQEGKYEEAAALYRQAIERQGLCRGPKWVGCFASSPW